MSKESICCHNSSPNSQIEVALTFVQIPAYLLCILHHSQYGHVFSPNCFLVFAEEW